MARMTPAEFQMWTKRLEATHRFWKANGLCGEDTTDTGYNAQMMFDAYAGRQWGVSWGGLGHEELFTVNVLFSTINTLMAQVSARNARPIVKPKGQTMASEDAARKALKNEILLTAVANEMKIKREVDRAIACAMLAPFGIVEHVYIPREEKYDSRGDLIERNDTSRPDFPSVRFRRIADVRIDPLASSPYPDGDARWVAFRDLYLLDEIKANPAFVDRHDLKPTVSADWMQERPRELQNSPQPDDNELVEVWKVYDKVERKWFCLSPGCSKPLREPADWPIGWESLPYDALCFHDRVDQMVPIAPASQIISLQVELNKCRTIMAALTKRMQRKVLVARDAMEDGEWEKMTGDAALSEYFSAKAGIDVGRIIAEVQVGGFPQELLLYHNRIVTDIYEVIGVSSMDRAQRINVETAAEANAVTAGSATMRSPKQEKVEDFWASVYRKLHRGIQQTKDDSVFLPIFEGTDARVLGETGGNYVEIGPQEILGEFDYGVQSGSTLPEDPMAEMQKAVALYTLFKDDAMVEPRELRRAVMEAARKDPQRWLNTTQNEMGAAMGDLANIGVGKELASAAPASLGGSGKAGGEGGGIDPGLLRSLQSQMGGPQ